MGPEEQPDNDGLSEVRLDELADRLVDQGWHVVPDFLPEAAARNLRASILRWDAEGRMRPAGIGGGERYQLLDEVRGDRILWMNPVEIPPEAREAWQKLEHVRVGLNRRLYLGLRDLEAHVALYPAGARYAKHLDRPFGTERRVVSVVLYLNDHWTADQGGHLRVYDRDDRERLVGEVEPRMGHLACFMSGEIPHEVMPMTATRCSLTGWFGR